MAGHKLCDRAVVEIVGDDAAGFLQGLVTSDVEGLAPGEMRASALLTPQGKVAFEMIFTRHESGLLADCRADMADALAKRLDFYRLRAKVQIARRDDLSIVWDPEGAEAVDPRSPLLGSRKISPQDGDMPDGAEAYHARRIAAGVAEAGPDYEPDTVFPHEANLDLLGGVSFAKGCFIGQEVVSRVEHRGTARKRFVPFSVEGDAPPHGAEVRAGERVIGTVGSSAGSDLVALVRLDRLAEALDAGSDVTAGGGRLSARIPDWLAPALKAHAAA